MPYFFHSLPRKYILLFLYVFLCLPVFAQQNAYRTYIETYKSLAVDQMHRYGIPASITLAQGLLESAAGQSVLARKANNHFGIKTGGTWNGPYVVKDDDFAGEHFRAYRSVEESYEDHSLFLRNRKRYASLFSLSATDYRGWAHGLKAAGYATNPQYAQRLIDLIERYDLHRYDKGHGKTTPFDRHDRDKGESVIADIPTGEPVGSRYLIRRCNYNYYVVATVGDTYASIAKWAGVSERKLRKYNEVPRKAALSPGEIVFLQKKRSKAARSLRGKTHTVRDGESLHAVSQHYGIRVATLYKKNKLPAGYVPRVGDVLVIR